MLRYPQRCWHLEQHHTHIQTRSHFKTPPCSQFCMHWSFSHTSLLDSPPLTLGYLMHTQAHSTYHPLHLLAQHITCTLPPFFIPSIGHCHGLTPYMPFPQLHTTHPSHYMPHAPPAGPTPTCSFRSPTLHAPPTAPPQHAPHQLPASSRCQCPLH